MLLDVVETHVVAPVEHGVYLSRERDGLGATRAGPPADVLVDRLCGEVAAGVGRQDQSDGVILHVRGQDNALHEGLAGDDLLGR